MTMTKLPVHDTIFVEREIEIPESCPRCGVGFRSGSNLRVWDWAESGTDGHIDENGEFEGEDYAGGEAYRASAYTCAACAFVVALGGSYVMPPNVKPTSKALAQALAVARKE